MQGKEDNVLPSQRLEVLSSGFLLEASRGRKASHPRTLTHVSNMSSGRSFRKVALKGRQKCSLRMRPAPAKRGAAGNMEKVTVARFVADWSVPSATTL